VDAAQLLPSTFVDVQDLDVDFMSFSCHKLLAPFGVGVLYGKRSLLESMRPCLYGGDMVATGGVTLDDVQYNELPWKFAAGTPNVLGVIVSSQALRLLIDLALTPDEPRFFRQTRQLEREDIRDGMNRIADYTQTLAEHAYESLARIPGLRIYGPTDPHRRTSLVAFNVAGWDPMALADALSSRGIESRAGCHCATLAHRFLNLNPPASCRLSFYFYNTLDEVDRATDAVASLVNANPA
jgi:cysteine desulfurase/selenocysteine lyase